MMMMMMKGMKAVESYVFFNVDVTIIRPIRGVQI
jgi:hypothetical protein